jgi:tetratricopeptide (TPR) repeat protein
MKCARCGAQLKEGCLYCSVCGYESKIEPDYTVLEDEYLSSILQEDEDKKKRQNTKTSNTNKKTENKKIKRQLLVVVVACVLIVTISIVAIVKITIQRKNANSYDYQVQQAQAELKEQNYDAALKYYAAALSLQPDDINVRLSMADIYMEKQDYDAALVLLMEVIASDTNNIEAYRNIIAIYDIRGDYENIVALSEGITDETLLGLFSDYLVSAPILSPAVGEYDEYIEIVPFSVKNYDIYYTLDGSDPTGSKARLYDTADEILLEKSGTYEIQAVCRNEKGINSDVVSGTYVINVTPPAYPVIEPDGGRIEGEQTVTIKAESNCTIYYTWDGTDPTTESEHYILPLDIPEGNNILSVLVVNNKTGLDSGIYRTNFIYYP